MVLACLAVIDIMLELKIKLIKAILTPLLVTEWLLKLKLE